jgi:hypothetical protein
VKPARLALATALVASASTVHAATALRTTTSAHQAEVGEGIRIEVSALSDSDDSPTNPRLRAPPGFSVQGPSVSSSQQISFSNGHFEHRRGITATWIVIGTRPGRFVIGPVTVDVGHGVVQGERIDVEVVAQGTIPRPPSNPRGFFDPGNPFDPFSMMQRLPGMSDLDEVPLLDAPPDAPADYLIPHATEPMAFLRAMATPAQAIVGEQVTLNVYAYAARGPYDEVNSAEPSRADFLSYSLIDSSFKQPRYILPIDGARYSVVKLRQIALFPLRAGALVVGPMRLGFRGPGYPETAPGGGLLRQSAPLSIVAVEPPLAGRPPGYELGDVGTYTLSAEVEPRRVQAGDAVSATIRLEGTGNVPHHVKVPEQNGVDWLDPTITEGVTPNETVIGGYRQFRYVVRLDEPGKRDLGEVTLPYYDPRSRRYEVARARLGTVEVLPGQAVAAPSASSSAGVSPAPRDPFEGLGKVRKTLGAPSSPPRHLSDKPAFWAFLFGAPGGIAAIRGLIALSRRLARRVRERSRSGAARAGQALSDARVAASKGDSSAVASAVERAVYTAIEDRLGVKARAVLRSDLTADLERRGADGALANDVAHLLDECDTTRFTGTADSSAQSLIDRGAAIVLVLGRVPRKTERPS